MPHQIASSLIETGERILSTPYVVLPLFANWFAACTGGMRVPFTETSHLNWYKMVCVRDLVSMCCQSEAFEYLLHFEHRTSLFSCICISMLTPNSSGNMLKHGYVECFHDVSARENMGISYYRWVSIPCWNISFLLSGIVNIFQHVL